MELLAFIGSHWLEWLFTAVLAVLSWLFKEMKTQLAEEKVKNEAIAEGVQSLLRESIVNNYNRYTDKGYSPIYAKESIKKVYKAYHNLGGNDVATELYNKVLKMAETPKEADDE
jgi:uncharacterized membrane protein